MISRVSIIRIGDTHIGFVKLEGMACGVFAYRKMRMLREWIRPKYRPLYWALLDDVLLGTPVRRRNHLRVVK